MAISSEQAILSLLKVYYAKEGVQNLLFRNSPVVKKLNKVRVEGKTQNFNALYGRGGAAGADYTAAVALASTVSKNVEFSVTPGQIFSVYTVNAKEVQASKTSRGAYMRVAGNKMFAASESFRKVMAAAFYGSGYGEIANITDITFVANTAIDITLPSDAIVKIDVGSTLEVKASTSATSVDTTLTVNSINGETVNVTPDTALTIGSGTYYIVCLAGSMDASGNPLLPIGLDGWLPVMAKRDSSDAGWLAYIGSSFFGVTRSVATDRLAGAFYDGTAEVIAAKQKKVYAIQTLLRKLRRQGSLADMIVLNDEDFQELSTEIEATNTYFTATSTKSKKSAAIGMSEFSAAFSTNFIENIIDDPYCIKGRFYILDSSSVELWSYTNTDKVDDGIANNNPGKQDPMTMEGDGKDTDPYGLIIDDYINAKPGTDTVDGPATQISLMFFGAFAVTNPSVCGVGEFYGSTDFAAA